MPRLLRASDAEVVAGERRRDRLRRSDSELPGPSVEAHCLVPVADDSEGVPTSGETGTLSPAEFGDEMALTIGQEYTETIRLECTHEVRRGHGAGVSVRSRRR